MSLFDMLANRISENPLYSDLLKQVLKTVVSMPPQLTKASDVLTYARDLQEYFSLLGIFLSNSFFFVNSHFILTL